MSDSYPRHLGLTGVRNFRDLGGYPARDGRTVRWRQIFRSNHLANITETDIGVLRGLGLKSAFDFRGIEERQSAISRLDGIGMHSLPIEPAIVTALRAHLDSGAPLSADETREMMRESYRNYVRGNTLAFRNLFTHLLEDHAPLVIHCTAGKDRTGFAAALILHALDVPSDVIANDYLLTNRYYRRDLYARTELSDDVVAVLTSVETSFLAASFNAIDADYGDLETYFAEALGLGSREREILEARYLDR